MPTNQYFNNFNHANEQDLQESLVVESIKMYGVETYYLPREVVKRDSIFREPQIERFNSNYYVEMFIESIMGFEGEGEFFSKFGIEARDQVVFTVARRTYIKEVGSKISQRRDRDQLPAEGDLIWIPMFGSAYQIQHVDHKSIFYQLGNLPTYKMTCMLFEYSNQIIETGMSAVDTKYNALYTGNSVANTNIELIDIQSMNTAIEIESDKIVVFTDADFEGRSF